MDKKNDRIVLRVSSADKLKLKEYALRHNITLSEMVLVAMLKLISEEQREEQKRTPNGG